MARAHGHSILGRAPDTVIGPFQENGWLRSVIDSLRRGKISPTTPTTRS
jgi:hypothetical protein